MAHVRRSIVPIVTDGEGIHDILTRYRRIAVVGLSSNPERPSHDVSQFMQAQGYEIYPVNPMIAGQEVLGQKVYASLADLPIRPEIVNVFRRSEFVPDVAEQAIAVGADVLWTQLFVVHDAAAQRASAAGLKVVQNRCLKIEFHKHGLGNIASRAEDDL
jgi:predicted CoA-binding protein